MTIADWVIIGLIALYCLLGLIIGFGRGLRFFTRGFFGFIISIVVCYLIGGLILKLDFVQGWLGSLRDVIKEQEGGFFDFLLTIRIDIITFYVALFIVVTIVRIIIISIISHIAEANNIVMRLINKFFGMVLFTVVFAALTLIVFQVLYLIGGEVSSTVESFFEGSALRLDEVYKNNPLMVVIEYIKETFTLTKRVPVVVPAG